MTSRQNTQISTARTAGTTTDAKGCAEVPSATMHHVVGSSSSNKELEIGVLSSLLLAALLVTVPASARAKSGCLDPVHEPPPGKAVVNLHYAHSGHPQPPRVAVWQDDIFLTWLFQGTAIQVEVEPGNHLFIASLGGRRWKAAVSATVEAGRMYDVDIRLNLALRPRMKPVLQGSKHWNRASKRLERECRVGPMFPGAPGIGIEIEPPIDEVIRRFRSGEWKDRLVRMNIGDGRAAQSRHE